MTPISNPDPLLEIRSEIDALPETDVLVPRVDVAAAALIAIGAKPEIDAHRDLVRAAFGEAGALAIDRVVPLAQALLRAHAAHTAVADQDLEPMARELAEVRSRLLLAASALVERGVVRGGSLDGLVGGQSYEGRVVDTMALVQWFRMNAAAIGSATKVSETELTAAQAMAEAFGKAFAERDQARAGTTPSARDRARAYTLFFRAYDRVRQMLLYLRWHQGDVDRIAPSIFAGRARRHDTVSSGDDAPAGLPASPAVAPGMPGAAPFAR